VPWTEEDDAKFAAMTGGSSKKNEAYWRNRLKGQGEIKTAPPRSAWRRFFDNLENTMRNYGPANIIARNVAPLIETGDGSTREERRAKINQMVRQRRENFAAVDPADSVGDHVVDFAGGLAGSALSDPTNFIGGFGKNLGERVVNMMGTNAAIDVGLQGIDVAQGVQDEYDPVQGAVSVAVPPAIVGASQAAKKAYRVIRPVVGKVTSGFGRRKAPKAGASTDHGGIDIAAPEGTVVQAPGAGVVSKVGRGHSKRGNWVEIDHGNGLTSRYLHLAGFRVKPGDKLEPGQLFGRVGKTGNVTGPHLHWSVLKDGKPVDPESVNFNLADVPSRPAHPMSPEEIARIVKDQEAGVQGRITPEEQRILDEADDGNLPRLEDSSNVVPFSGKYIDAKLSDNVVEGPDGFFMYRNKDGSLRDLTPEEQQAHFDTNVARHGLRTTILDDMDQLTPAERQEMDASVTGRPPAENTGYEKFTPYMEPKKAANDSRVDMFNHPTRLNERGSANARGVEYEEVWISPDEYTKAAGLVNPISPKEGPVNKLQKKLETEGLQNTPFLHFDKDGKLTSQEGLHRVAALKNLGYDKIPVRVYGKPKGGLVNFLKELFSDESGSFRPFGRKGYRDDSEGPNQSPDRTDLPRTEAEDKIIRALRDAKPLNNEQRRLYHEERAKRAAILKKIQQEPGGLENYKKQLANLKGDLPKVNYESIAKEFTEDDYKALFTKINQSNSLLEYEKLTAQSALVKLLSEQGAKLPTPSEIRLLSEVFSPDFIEALLKNQPFLEQLKKTAVSALNVPRALMASADISAPFRQGIFLIGRKEFWKSLGPMFKVLFSEKNSKALLSEIKGRDSYRLMKEAGLAITDPHNHFLLDKEEDFMTDLAEKIPVWGRVVKASNRAYSGFLNRLRADYFDHMVKKYEEAGIDLAADRKRLRGLAKFINSATGRGDLGKLNAAAPLLNNLFFSPRLIKARIDMLNPVTYVQRDPIVRKEAWKNLMSLGAVATGVASLATMAGMDVETDPRSSDFMKPKTGNTRYDILGGFQQYIRLGALINPLNDHYITAKGDKKEFGGKGKFDKTKAKIIGDFFRSKENPIISFAHNYFDKQNVIGEKFNRTTDVGGFKVPSEVLERFIPMASQDIIDAYKEHGNKGILMAAPALTGVGVQTYDPNEPKEEDPNKDFEDFKKSFQLDDFEDFKKSFE
jgi:murein DD-endopeptidase MepM/ murein hydrolase activator NlpD